jgi:hypothetical protein
MKMFVFPHAFKKCSYLPCLIIFTIHSWYYISTTDEITELNSVKNSKILCSSKLDINSGLSQSQTESEAYQTDQTPSSIKQEIKQHKTVK